MSNVGIPKSGGATFGSATVSSNVVQSASKTTVVRIHLARRSEHSSIHGGQSNEYAHS